MFTNKIGHDFETIQKCLQVKFGMMLITIKDPHVKLGMILTPRIKKLQVKLVMILTTLQTCLQIKLGMICTVLKHAYKSNWA